MFLIYPRRLEDGLKSSGKWVCLYYAPTLTHIHILSYSDLHSRETSLLEEGWQSVRCSAWLHLNVSFFQFWGAHLTAPFWHTERCRREVRELLKAVSHTLADSIGARWESTELLPELLNAWPYKTVVGCNLKMNLLWYCNGLTVLNANNEMRLT